MSKVKQQDIDRLIVLVGGRENIATVSHCITRLRFVLNDPNKAKPKRDSKRCRWSKGASPTPGSSRW
ncbi:EIIBC-Tre [Serratia marcescens]|uniref:EIIBC-Tre n=1 Tax=Serratia marcescens TaxID=615 RepID=A0A379Y4E1_SERMA|nr:EIIBC-Tre [Serratia marcescens]